MPDDVRRALRLAIVAPTHALRAGLRSILTGQDSPASPAARMEVIFEAGSLLEFREYAPQTDVLILDVELTAGASLQQLASLEEGQMGLLLLSDSPQAARALMDLPLRGWGILPLDASADELLAAVQAVGEGLVAGASALLKPLLRREFVAAVSESNDAGDALTERESQVLQLLALGLANKQIAQQLSISEHTVKFHVSSIYGKLGATNRTEAVRTGLQRGLISL
jgi:DNA-binding NarL/FixJ family response regulator